MASGNWCFSTMRSAASIFSWLWATAFSQSARLVKFS